MIAGITNDNEEKARVWSRPIINVGHKGLVVTAIKNTITNYTKLQITQHDREIILKARESKACVHPREKGIISTFVEKQNEDCWW